MFWQSLRNTIIFTAGSMVLIVVFGKVLANILVADFHGKWIVRFLVLLPWTTPVALSAIAWLWMLDSIFSPIDWMLRQVGLIDGNMYWLGRPNLALLSVIAVHAWRLIPLAAVIMMAGLVAIPKDLQEQAEVDGAGFWRRMFEITIPLMMPLIAVAALFGAIVTFTDMTVVYVLTRGGPTNSTQVLASWAFFRGIEGGDIAQGAAVALFLFPLLLAAAILDSSGGASEGGVVTWRPSIQSADGIDTVRRSTAFGAAQSSVTDWLVWGCTWPPLLPHSSVPVRSCGR